MQFNHWWSIIFNQFIEFIFQTFIYLLLKQHTTRMLCRRQGHNKSLKSLLDSKTIKTILGIKLVNEWRQLCKVQLPQSATVITLFVNCNHSVSGYTLKWLDLYRKKELLLLFWSNKWDQINLSVVSSKIKGYISQHQRNSTPSSSKPRHGFCLHHNYTLKLDAFKCQITN